MIEELKRNNELTYTGFDGVFNSFECELSNFENLCFYIQSSYGYIWLLELKCDLLKTQNVLEMKYYFSCAESSCFFSFTFKMRLETQLKSVAHLWKNAAGLEQEVFELFGVGFSRQYKHELYAPSNSKPLMLTDHDMSALGLCESSRSDIGYKKMTLNTQDSIDLNFSSTEDKISSCELEKGFFHIGLEKILEGEKGGMFYPLIEGYFRQENLIWSSLASMNFELEHEVDVPARAKALRMILLELNRIQSHLRALRKLSLNQRNDFLFKNSLLWEKKIQALLISYTERGDGAGVIRPGGVSRDIKDSWASEVLFILNSIKKDFTFFYTKIFKRGSWAEALNIELISKKKASFWSATGPLLRSSGVNLDFRKKNPFYFYDDVQFEVPIGSRGTIYDLYLVRMEEVLESFSIIIQLLDNLPSGSVYSLDYQEFDTIKTTLNYSKAQDFADHFYDTPNINKFSFLEGGLGIYGLSQRIENSLFQRVKFITPSFSYRDLYESIMHNKRIHDAPVIWDALNLNLIEAER